MVKNFLIKSLGMQFEDTSEDYTKGKHIGEPIQKVVIKSEDDLPEKVMEYFRCSNEFLSKKINQNTNEINQMALSFKQNLSKI